MPDQSDTIDSFCESEQISRSMFYKLKSQGKGPQLYYVGVSPRISPEAKAKWRREREAEAAAAQAEVA